MRISIIAALAANGVIGRDNELPWHMPADLKYFKARTMGHHLLLGRKTWQSVGRPLPGRTFIVITRDPDFTAEGVQVAHGVEEAIRLAATTGDEEIFIGGGEEIFRQSLHRADRMYLTRIHADIEGDTVFPEFDDVTEWQLTDSEHFEADEKNPHPYSFLVYERAAGEGHAIPDEG